MISKLYGKWTVLELSSNRGKNKSLKYICRCECGSVQDVNKYSLIYGTSTQCKKCFTSRIDNKISDIINKKFGMWTVLSKFKSINGITRIEVLCDCGSLSSATPYTITSGRSDRCFQCRRVPRTHNLSNSPTYAIWNGMHQRCSNKKNKDFKHYGGRGIKVSERWIKFENFLSDMGIKPNGLEIDRIDNDGNYEPSNCRWVTRNQNNNNKKRERQLLP